LFSHWAVTSFFAAFLAQKKRRKNVHLSGGVPPAVSAIPAMPDIARRPYMVCFAQDLSGKDCNDCMLFDE
jgi:hypothetical protein